MPKVLYLYLLPFSEWWADRRHQRG